MARIARRCGELVGLDMQELRQRAKRFAVAIDELSRGDAFARSGEDVLQTVVIGSGRETSSVSATTAMSRENIGEHELVGKADVWTSVDEWNCGRDERRSHSDPPVCRRPPSWWMAGDALVQCALSTEHMSICIRNARFTTTQ
jgi:hypothetical protein